MTCNEGKLKGLLYLFLSWIDMSTLSKWLHCLFVQIQCRLQSLADQLSLSLFFPFRSFILLLQLRLKTIMPDICWQMNLRVTSNSQNVYIIWRSEKCRMDETNCNIKKFLQDFGLDCLSSLLPGWYILLKDFRVVSVFSLPSQLSLTLINCPVHVYYNRTSLTRIKRRVGRECYPPEQFLSIS